eukprot:EG_transcript_6933
MLQHCRRFAWVALALSRRCPYSTTGPTERYDLCVLGAGAAGFAGATRAWDLGKKVVIVEQHRNRVGGAKVWDGAVTSKTMWHLARKSRVVNEFLKARGMMFEERIGEILECSLDAAQVQSNQMEQQLKALKEPYTFKRQKPTRSPVSGTIDLKYGLAKFTGPNEVEIEDEEGHVQHIEADYFLLATGSVPREDPRFPVDGYRIITSDHVMQLKQWPKRILILGAGILGCEFATIFQNFGQSQVHLVNLGQPRLLHMEDQDLTDYITARFQLAGTRIHNNVNLMKATVRPNGVLCSMGRRMAGKGKNAVYKEDFALQVDCVLLAIGRDPNIQGLGLELAGVELTQRHGATAIKLDDTKVRSASAPHVYVAGDVTSEIGLVSVAELGARRAIEYMFDPSQFLKQKQVAKYSYENVSSVLFLNPEVACVGMNEAEARRLGLPYQVAVLDLSLMTRALISYQRIPSRLRPGSGVEQRLGFVKMIVTDDDDKILLGMRCAGREVSAIIETAALLVRDRRSVREMLRVLHPHPAITEAVQECARLLVGHSMLKHHVFKGVTQVRSFSLEDAKQHWIEYEEGKPIPLDNVRAFLKKRNYDDDELADFFMELSSRLGPV